ncbi:MAG: InlB B-repeat-containing protein, partial [Oscillospiraceae bacterium]|nr:InlB B-repeat-containing protein [Oscillospiraceae bacterium]
TLDSEIQLVGTTNSTGLNSVDLTGEAGFKAYFAIWSYEKPWAYRTWNLYTRNKNPNTAALKTASVVSDDNSIYDIDSYSIQNLSYLKGESGWLGANQSGSGMLHTSSASNSTTEIMPLITQTYRDSRPMIVSAGDTMVMVYTGSDQSRTVYNHTRVMYSVYDKATNSWSEPNQLDNNNTLDMTPHLYSDGTNIYVVYSDATRVFDESDSIETVIASQNIAVSKFNFENNGFDNPTVLVPSDGKYNSVPIIGTADGVPTVIYQCNASNSVFGTTSDNSIIKVTLNGEKETVASNLNSIVGYAVGSKGVAYIIDSDNVLSTYDDRLLYLNGDFIEAGVVSNPQFSSNGKMYWYSNGTVKEYDNGINEIYPEGIPGFTDSFKVLDNKIVYLTATSENTSNIMQLNFENDSWSQPVLLVNQDKIIDTFSATEFGGEIVSVMTRRNVTITESSVDDECEIAWTAIKDRHDICVNYVDYEHDDVKPNSSLAITAGILNSGTADIKKLNVEITNSAGEVVYSQNQDVSIKPAEDFELTATVPIGEVVSLDEYSVKVTEVGIDDCNETDNSYKVKIGYSQFFVNSETLIGGDNRSLMVTIRNDGYTASGGTLNVYNSFNNEEPVVSYGISKISNGEQKLCRIDVTEEMLGGKSGKLYLEFEPDVEQFNAFDNKTEAYIELCSHENIGDWVVETEATCTQPGEKVKRCVDCSVAMESEEITPHGHGETETVIITATCTESGRTYEACSICGEALSDITETNPIGHKEGQWKVLAEPTIYLEGYEILCCENCNVVLDERIIPKKVFSKVTWIVDGQEKVQTYISGDLISSPENPQMDGYRFVGWTPEVPETMPDYDLTFTAVFEKIEAPNDGKTVVSIKHPSTTTINYGESLTLYATASNLPEGGKIKWRIVEGTGVSIEPSRSGMYCIVTSESTGNVVIEAYAVDSHGNIITDESGNICSDKEGIHSEDNLWLRIVYFFRKLFGINKVYSQFFKVIF